MATRMTSPSFNNKKIVWFWQSNLNVWDENEKEWKRYSDFENEFIEEAFQRQEKEVQLNDYIINFTHNIQFKKDDTYRQRLVKRELIDVSQYVRGERFSYPERPVKSFGTDIKWDNSVIKHWNEKNKEIASNYSAIAELAAQGILKEGKLLNQDFDAQIMVDQLQSCEPNSDKLGRCAIRLYTASTFLYNLVNSTLRNKDMSKVDTLGPFCSLLSGRLFSGDYSPRQIVYRGATLTAEMVEEYKQAIGTEITWLSFTSTTKNRCVAEFYSGNTLFIITLEEKIWSYEQDISSLSHYPDEEEVLLTAGYQFQVEKVEFDSTNGKHMIYMTTLSGKNFLNPNMHISTVPKQNSNDQLDHCVYIFGSRSGMLGTAALSDGQLRIFLPPGGDVE